MKEEVEKVLKQIQPRLEGDGGGIELVEVDEEQGIVKVRLLGACAGCPMRQMTLKMGVEAAIQEAVPAVKEVIAVE
ncbi:NifU family protein [Patescibacteria group bacterium]|nr:NifU family protein [Patescibacteria group bacterium]MBU1705554.1 NifU family protein [Patescibacteria group bacterium]